MSKKVKWGTTKDMPKNVQRMCDAFEAAFGNGVHNCTISHWRSDAVFIQCNGILNAYGVARFCKQNRDIYIELEAVASGYWNVRLFDSIWMKEREIPSKMRFMELPQFLPSDHPYAVRMKIDAH